MEIRREVMSSGMLVIYPGMAMRRGPEDFSKRSATRENENSSSGDVSADNREWVLRRRVNIGRVPRRKTSDRLARISDRGRHGDEPVWEDRMGRHEGPEGLKPPVTSSDHAEALAVEHRGRHEKTPPVFRSSFADAYDAVVIPAKGGWFETSREPGSE